MHRRFVRGILLCLTAAAALQSGAGVVAPAVAETAAASADEPYTLSYAAGGYDADQNFLGGTTLMNLAGFGGKLYAGVGYWMDQAQFFSQHKDPRSPAQVLVLDAKSAQWRQEYAFGQRNDAGAFKYNRLDEMKEAHFHRFDAAGTAVGTVADLLVIGLGGPDGAVYSQLSPGRWEDTRIPTSDPIRAIAMHYDANAKEDRIFAAGGVLAENIDWDIYSGAYDASAPGRIRWDPNPETIGPHDRVMSMTECDGALFAAARPSIFRRDDAAKTWRAIYSYPVSDPFDLSKFASGFRGLTCITGPDGKKALLSGFEGGAGDILRIDPQTGAAVFELHARQFLTEQWGSAPTKRDIIAGYNDIPAVKGGPNGVRLFGLLARNADAPNSAWFLSRTTGESPGYRLHEVKPPEKFPFLRSDGALWSVVAIAVSPFPEDHGQIVYLGGYDGHFEPDHNTAWLDRVGIDAALAPYREGPH